MLVNSMDSKVSPSLQKIATFNQQYQLSMSNYAGFPICDLSPYQNYMYVIMTNLSITATVTSVSSGSYSYATPNLDIIAFTRYQMPSIYGVGSTSTFTSNNYYGGSVYYIGSNRSRFGTNGGVDDQVSYLDYAIRIWIGGISVSIGLSVVTSADIYVMQ